jgi:hypothetical protein
MNVDQRFYERDTEAPMKSALFTPAATVFVTATTIPAVVNGTVASLLGAAYPAVYAASYVTCVFLILFDRELASLSVWERAGGALGPVLNPPQRHWTRFRRRSHQWIRGFHTKAGWWLAGTMTSATVSVLALRADIPAAAPTAAGVDLLAAPTSILLVVAPLTIAAWLMTRPLGSTPPDHTQARLTPMNAQHVKAAKMPRPLMRFVRYAYLLSPAIPLAALAL